MFKRSLIFAAVIFLMTGCSSGKTHNMEDMNSLLTNGNKEISEKKIKQTAGRDKLGKFASNFAHYNDDILFG